jgi:phosphoglycerol geranylgeranyltransferase
MKVLENLMAKLEKEKVHMTLLDPEKAIDTGVIGEHIEKAGSDAIMLGGSTGIDEKKLDETIDGLKKSTGLPIILFPSSSRSLSKHADAIYFMSLLNSTDVRIIVGEQRRAARIIKGYGLETIPMGYVFGMKLVYLEAGSGAPRPVTAGMVSAVKNEIEIPLIVGGGIRTAEDAGNLAEAGADIVVTGTIVEKDASVLGDIVKSVKEARVK